MGSGAMRRHSVFLIAVLAMFTICRQPTLTGWDDAFYVAQLTSALGEAAATAVPVGRDGPSCGRGAGPAARRPRRVRALRRSYRPHRSDP